MESHVWFRDNYLVVDVYVLHVDGSHVWFLDNYLVVDVYVLHVDGITCMVL